MLIQQLVVNHYLPYKSLLCQYPLCSGPLNALRSITNVTTSCPMHCSASPWHGSYQMCNPCLRMSSHTSWIDGRNCGTVCGGGSRDLMRRSIRSHGCSMGDRLGKYTGQGSLWTALALMNSCVRRAVWGWVLSCWKSQPLTLGVGQDIRFDHLVHVTFGVEGAVQNDKCSPLPTVFPTPNHHTPPPEQSCSATKASVKCLPLRCHTLTPSP